MKQPKVVLLIFVSGKVVLTGSPSCLLKLNHNDPGGLTEYSLPCQHLLMKKPGSDLELSVVLDGLSWLLRGRELISVALKVCSTCGWLPDLSALCRA